MKNQGGGKGQDGSLSIAIEMTQTNNGYDTLKESKKVKITENEDICKILVSYI